MDRNTDWKRLIYGATPSIFQRQYGRSVDFDRLWS